MSWDSYEVWREANIYDNVLESFSSHSMFVLPALRVAKVSWPFMGHTNFSVLCNVHISPKVAINNWVFESTYMHKTLFTYRSGKGVRTGWGWDDLPIVVGKRKTLLNFEQKLWIMLHILSRHCLTLHWFLTLIAYA